MRPSARVRMHVTAAASQTQASRMPDAARPYDREGWNASPCRKRGFAPRVKRRPGQRLYRPERSHPMERAAATSLSGQAAMVTSDEGNMRLLGTLAGTTRVQPPW